MRSAFSSCAVNQDVQSLFLRIQRKWILLVTAAFVGGSKPSFDLSVVGPGVLEEDEDHVWTRSRSRGTVNVAPVEPAMKSMVSNWRRGLMRE